MGEVKLLRCKICGDPYVGEVPPSRCPFCGALGSFIIEARDYKETFDVELTDKDKANAKKALELEISNTSFYFCAAEKTDDEEGRQLFKALGKVEAEHASIWRRILKLPNDRIPAAEDCSSSNKENLQESHDREDNAIQFYRKAAQEADSPRIKQIFGALVLVETDHLKLSEERLK